MGTCAVRIERCGEALCGYVLNLASLTTADAVLIDMKPSSDLAWSGRIYSRSSGATYCATMTVRGDDRLRARLLVLLWQ